MFQSAHYPISKLIARIISDSGLRRSEFVKSIGYKSVQGGLRKLDEWLQNGCGDDGCLQRIVDAYAPDPSELKAAMAATESILDREHPEGVAEIEERERRRFRPFIWVHTADSAHSFLTAMGERQVKVLWLAEGTEKLPKPDQIAVAQRRIREHYQQTTGRYVGFGEILRYQFADTFDTSIVLDVHGNVVEQNGGQFLLPEVWLALH